MRAQVPTRISVGERLYTRFEFLPVLTRHLTDYVMPDVTWTGGISELKKIATLAEMKKADHAANSLIGGLLVAGIVVGVTIAALPKCIGICPAH